MLFAGPAVASPTVSVPSHALVSKFLANYYSFAPVTIELSNISGERSLFGISSGDWRRASSVAFEFDLLLPLGLTSFGVADRGEITKSA